MGEYSLKKNLTMLCKYRKAAARESTRRQLLFLVWKGFSKRLGNSQKLLGQSVIALNVEMYAVGQTVGVSL